MVLYSISRYNAVPIMDELINIIIRVMAAHQNAMIYGELMSCFSPNGTDPVAKVPIVKMSEAAKQSLRSGAKGGLKTA